MMLPGLTPDQSQILAAQFTGKMKLARGGYFLKEGKVCNAIGIVTKGMCRHFYKTKDGDVTRWVALTGTYVVSLKSFIQQSPSVENIQAIETSEVVTISRESWLKLYDEHEFIRNYWLKNIEVNYIGMEERVFNLIAKTAEERYYWMLENQLRLIQEVPDKHLASMLGIHPRHMSRIRALRK